MSTIYQHPDGHSIDFTNNTLTVVSSDGMAVSVPMGAAGLRQLGKSLETSFTESDCAAQAGAAIAENCLDAMLAANDQTDRANLLAAALVDLATLKHHEHAAGGFAGALVAVIERGLKRIGNASQLDNIFMQNEVGRMMAERESEICNGPSNIDVDDCLICGRATEILNVGREHFAVCLPCKTYRHIGSNLFSGWKFETPGDWAKNRQILDALIEHKLAPTPAPDDAPMPF